MTDPSQTLSGVVSPQTWRDDGAELMPEPVGSAKTLTLTQYGQLWSAPASPH